MLLPAGHGSALVVAHELAVVHPKARAAWCAAKLGCCAQHHHIIIKVIIICRKTKPQRLRIRAPTQGAKQRKLVIPSECYGATRSHCWLSSIQSATWWSQDPQPWHSNNTQCLMLHPSPPSPYCCSSSCCRREPMSDRESS